MEHNSKGQIGQPAACMIENKKALSVAAAIFRTRDYGPKVAPPNAGSASVATAPTIPRSDCFRMRRRTSTAAVDIFVGNWVR